MQANTTAEYERQKFMMEIVWFDERYCTRREKFYTLAMDKYIVHQKSVKNDLLLLMDKFDRLRLESKYV